MTLYGGVEWTATHDPKARGMAIGTLSLGPFRGLAIVEVAGVTGNFNKQEFGLAVGKFTTSRVWHSVAGQGWKLKYEPTPTLALYGTALRRRATIGVVYSY